MEETSKAVGCMGTVLIVLLLGWVVTAIGKCSAPAEQEGFPGPIPVRYQGAYNSYMCGQGADGLVTVGGDDINYGGAKFDVTDLVSESQNSITLRGEPIAANGRETSRTFTITYAPVGGTARLDGAEFERCSQY